MKVHGTRRQMIQSMGGAGAILVLGRSAVPISAAQGGEASPEALASSGLITIQPTGVELPTEPVTFTWMVRGAGSKAIFLKEFIPVYQEAHPNITIQYEGLPPAELTRILPLGFQNGNPPDCFEVSDTIPASVMVSEGWVRPLDDLIPNFEEWKQSIPPGVLVEGITVFDGKVYGFPYLSNQVSRLTLYNSAYMEQAGYDPSAEPLTWDEFRDAAKKITEQGAGNYYGYIIGGSQPDQWAEAVSHLAQMAGDGGAIDWHTGQYQYTADMFQGAIELLLSLKADGSVFPGALQLDNVDARARVAGGEAGIILEGPWNIPVWNLDYPDFDFGVSSIPVPSKDAQPTFQVEPGAWLPLWVAAESEHPEIAGDIFAYLASEEGQIALAAITQGFPVALSASAREKAAEIGEVDPRMLEAYEIFESQVRTAPDPRARNADIQEVYAEFRRITPNFGEVVQGLFTGQLSDVQQALQDLQDRSEAELERAIKAAQEKGAEVSREDWVFPNWEPSEHYTSEYYDALES
jgi:multiple sugar transport system substrate-binding protein